MREIREPAHYMLLFVPLIMLVIWLVVGWITLVMGVSA